jgi:hypothetical protein
MIADAALWPGNTRLPPRSLIEEVEDLRVHRFPREHGGKSSPGGEPIEELRSGAGAGSGQ